MNEDRAQQLIIGCLAAAAAIGAGNAIAEGRAPELRQVVGFTFVALGLSTAAMFAPGLAGSAAVLVLTTTAFLYGDPLYEAVTGVTGPQSSTGTRPTHPTSTTTRKV